MEKMEGDLKTALAHQSQLMGIQSALLRNLGSCHENLKRQIATLKEVQEKMKELQNENLLLKEENELIKRSAKKYVGEIGHLLEDERRRPPKHLRVARHTNG